MANDVVIRFIAQDEVTATANKVAGSVDGVDKAAKQAKDSSTGLGGALGGIGGKVAGITAAAGAIIATGAKIFEAATNAAMLNDKFENVRKSLDLMSGSQAIGNELYKTMEDLAARTPFTFDDIAQSTQKLLAMGFVAKDIPGIMTAIGDAASATGTGADGVNRITLALGQMQAKGKITTEEMMQLQELGIPAFRLLADASGVSQQALMDMVSRGVIPAEQNLNTLISAMEGNYGGMMSSQMNTATQAQSNFQDATDKATAAVGKIVEPTVIRFYGNLTDSLGWLTQALQGAVGWFQWLDTAMVTPQLRLQGYTDAQIAATLAIRGNTYETQGNVSEQYALQRVYGSMTGSTTKQTVALNIGTGATKGNSSASNQLTQDQNKLKSATDSLKTSFLNIASAQRDVTRTRQALEDATNPETLQGYENAADRAFYSNQLLTNEITRMTARQKDVRNQLAKGNITQENRNELQIEDAQLTEDLIGKNIDAKDSIISLHKAQKELDRARDPARIQEYADAHTNSILRLNELNDKQIENIDTINTLNTKLGANVDVTNLVAQAAGLAAVPMNNFDMAGANVVKTYGGTTGVNTLLNTTSTSISSISSASSGAAAGIGNVNTALGTLATVDVSKTAGLIALGGSLNQLSSAATSLKGIDFVAILGGVSGAAAGLTYAVVTLWGTLATSLDNVKKALDAIKAAAGSGSGGGGTNPVTPTPADLAAVKDALSSAASDRLITNAEVAFVRNIATARGVTEDQITAMIKDLIRNNPNIRTENAPVYGQSVPGTMALQGTTAPVTAQANTASGQVINITLNYATPPDSRNPLKDVQDYITAQGGLLRI